jgi:hypothetical protein
VIFSGSSSFLLKINLNSDIQKSNPYQESNQNRTEKSMTYDVENPRPGLEEIHIICLLFRFVVFQELYRGGQI